MEGGLKDVRLLVDPVGVVLVMTQDRVVSPIVKKNQRKEINVEKC